MIFSKVIKGGRAFFKIKHFNSKLLYLINRMKAEKSRYIERLVGRGVEEGRGKIKVYNDSARDMTKTKRICSIIS